MNQPDARTAAEAGLAALARGDAPQARDLLRQAAAGGIANASLQLALAQALEKLGDESGKSAAIDRALALEPRNLQALVAKADGLAQTGDARAASAYYSAALQYMPRYNELPAHVQQLLQRAKAAIESLKRELEDFVRARLAASGFDGRGVSSRFESSVDMLLTGKRAYVQEPRYFYFPELPQIEFFPREMFPWLDQVEACTAQARAELDGVIAESGGFDPYLSADPNRPARQQKGMVGNPDWGAYFMRKDGAVQAGATRCPNILAALADAPLTDIPGRAPSILFSRLAPGAHIPPHTGMLNVRLICHLALIAPEGCALRVGNSVKSWIEGKAWVFDDTIEHEAWNRSGQDRYVLLFDIWRPELSADERSAVAALCLAIEDFGGGKSFGV